MNKVTIVTQMCDAHEGSIRYEYPGILVDACHAFYLDAEYNTVILERVNRVYGEYHTTGGPGAVGFDLIVDDATFFERITEMSAVELLSALIRRNISA
ncbi:MULTISPECIES: hypothetical protein [Paenibacillus]|uniref:hypothetical protein n=1 Tax=Paenibacillus TaxID=44249 RepID=UPI00096E1374|nr:hypothetical protein [Paenibacillus odorifer]OME21568.1 hypothetical protein BSK57_19670 [Paenibacillus odorifer]